MLCEVMFIVDLGIFGGGVFGLFFDWNRKIILYLYYNGGF